MKILTKFPRVKGALSAGAQMVISSQRILGKLVKQKINSWINILKIQKFLRGEEEGRGTIYLVSIAFPSRFQW